MRPIKLAVLSDLHIGYGARSRDMCPYADSKAVENRFTEEFDQFVRNSSISADFLVLPGDISDKGQAAEFRLASSILAGLARSLNVASDRILFAPGNHDADWAVMKLDGPAEFRRTQRYDPLKRELSCVAKHDCVGLLDEPYFSIREHAELVMVAYNSSWHDDPQMSVHHGMFDYQAIDQLQERLAGIDMGPSRLKIFLAHHHATPTDHPIPNQTDFSAMTNAERLLDLLGRLRFDLVIHGHKHRPACKSYIIDASYPLVVISSGSFCAELESRWSGYVNNQFHLLTIDGRDSETEAVYGVLRSWTYLAGRGWLESRPHNGIRHTVPFGTYMTPTQLIARLRSIIEAGLAVKDYMEWDAIIEDNPDLAYAPVDRVLDALSTLSRDLGFRCHGEPPDPIVLLKR